MSRPPAKQSPREALAEHRHCARVCGSVAIRGDVAVDEMPPIAARPTGAEGELTPSRSASHTTNFISCLIMAAQNGFGLDVDPFLALSHETWDEEILFDAVKDLPHGRSRRTRLMFAAATGNVPRLRWLFARGANLELRDRSGQTALFFAAWKGHAGAAAALLQRGAAVDAKNVNGGTPLWVASEGGFTGVVQALLSRGAAVDAANAKRATPLFIASEKGRLEVVRALLAGGASLEARNEAGSTPLQIAGDRGHAAVVAELRAKANGLRKK